MVCGFESQYTAREHSDKSLQLTVNHSLSHIRLGLCIFAQCDQGIRVQKYSLKIIGQR